MTPQQADDLLEAVAMVVSGGDEHFVLRRTGSKAWSRDCEVDPGKPLYHTCPHCWFEEFCDDLEKLTRLYESIVGEEGT